MLDLVGTVDSHRFMWWEWRETDKRFSRQLLLLHITVTELCNCYATLLIVTLPTSLLCPLRLFVIFFPRPSSSCASQ